ncbi:MAG TPA: ATP-binding protein [Thermoanaerobaculia bacterium]|nr:ATP-binding protein [Thermoanaerobaculia bacterium]
MEAILLIGIQGAGKSTFYRERFFDTHVRINLDMLKTRYRERVLLSACLLAKQPFVVDNTNVLAKERARFIEPARENAFRVHAYFFEPDVRASIARNARRTGKGVIPVKGVLGTHKRLEPPRLEEGFDRIYRVLLTPKGGWEVEEMPELIGDPAP